MELDLQSLFGLLCTAVLIGWDPATPPLHPWALLVRQDRQHLFVTPWFGLVWFGLDGLHVETVLKKVSNGEFLLPKVRQLRLDSNISRQTPGQKLMHKESYWRAAYRKI